MTKYFSYNFKYYLFVVNLLKFKVTELWPISLVILEHIVVVQTLSQLNFSKNVRKFTVRKFYHEEIYHEEIYHEETYREEIYHEEIYRPRFVKYKVFNCKKIPTISGRKQNFC